MFLKTSDKNAIALTCIVFLMENYQHLASEAKLIPRKRFKSTSQTPNVIHIA